MDSSNDSLERFPVTRYLDYGEIDCYYPYGNTPAEDFLENVSPHSVKEPNVLVLGCGDIRSCFYSLWKHFASASSGPASGPRVSPTFSGIHFVLNDHSAAVLARNVIFLYLCLKKPVDSPSEEFKKWLCGLWAIWFSRNLLPAHEQMLNSALRDLLNHAMDMTSWVSRENPISSFVQFSSEHTLSEIRNVWRMWSTRSIDINAISERQVQYPWVSASCNTDLENLVGMAMSTSLSSQQRERMEYEIQHCSKNPFAEYVVSEGRYLPPRTLAENLTLCESSDGKFLLHSLLPFRCFHHGFQFSPSQLRLNGNNEKLLGELPVTDELFKQYPLLANSVQQFSLWLSSASTILRLSSIPTSQGNSMQCATFTLHCSDAIGFCNDLQNPASTLKVEKKFDVIYTSNLIDPLYPPNLILFATPLLKPTSYLFTTTIKYKALAHTAQDYLENSFGIDNKMLPLLFGIRCINYEGSQYKNMVSIRPAPIERNAVSPEFTPYYVKILVWERVPSMIVSSIPPDSSLWHALYSSVSTILSLPRDTFDSSSSQTVVKMLQTFLSHINADDSSGQFWDPLCLLLQSNKNSQHLMTVLQTHSMLSGLHLHLIVTRKTCPVCNGISSQKYFGQFCVSLKPLSNYGIVNIYARIHKPNEQDSYKTFDCLASQSDGDSLRLYFVAPLQLCESGYYVSIISCGKSRPLIKHITGPLKSFSASEITYSFSSFKTQNRSCNTSLGSLSSHYGNGDTFESVIQLSDVGYEAYSKSKRVIPEQMLPTLIKISCDTHNLELSYPYPVKFNTLSLTSKRTITILATRARHRFEDEMASVFLVNPENILTLPQSCLQSIVEHFFMHMQFTDDERLLLMDPTSCPPLPALKNCIHILMQEKKEHFFTFADPSRSLFAMVTIVNRVFDYQLKAPAIDLVYCVTTAKTTLRKWGMFSSCVGVYKTNRATIQLMDRTFQYFSRRTICSSQAECLLSLQRKVDSSFKRAVVYPLYGDADDIVCNQRKMWEQNLIKVDPVNKEQAEMIENQCCSFCGKLSLDLKKCDYCQTVRFCDICQAQLLTLHTILCRGNSTKTKSNSESDISPSSPSSDHLSSQTCANCHKSSAHLKKCLRCHSALYCNQNCQKKHWKKHKTLCKQPTEKSSTCSYCNTSSSKLKRCTVCFSAQYCDKECQQKHWNEHKLHCSKPEEKLTSQTKSSDDQICSFCSRVAKDLKKCKGCLRVQYCDKTCQQKHWPDHKIMCKSTS